jgi:signal transduction histidine kinase
MRFLHVLRRDVRAHVWDYALAGVMVFIAIVVLITRIDVADGSIDTSQCSSRAGARCFAFAPDTAWSWAAVIAICALLAGRRRWPLRVFAIDLALLAAIGLTKHRDGVAFFALMIAAYSVAAYLPFRLARRGLGMLAVLFVIGTIFLPPRPGADLFNGPAFLGVGFAVGHLMRSRRVRQDRDADRALKRAAQAVETADLNAAEERLRLAQELHDVVAHSLSVIAVQAGIGAHLIDRRPADAQRAFDAITTTSLAATDELHRLVDVLRDSNSHGRTQAPALNEVAALVDQIRTTGVPITYTVDGVLTQVPAGVSLAAYRIVQEALTNIVRHAGHAEALVTVRVNDDRVELTIEDNGRGTTAPVDPSEPATGHGLIGMGERAEMYGGVVHSGPRPGGGFRIRATLPCSSDSSANETLVTPTVAPVDAPDAFPENDRWRLSPRLWDVALATLMAVLVTVEGLGAQPAPSAGATPFSSPHWWTWALRIGCCVMLATRRRYPTISFLTASAAVAALSISDDRVGVIGLVLATGLYTVGSYAGTRRLAGSLVGMCVTIAVVAWSKPPDLDAAGAVWISILYTATAIAGCIARRDRIRRDHELAQREGAADAYSQRARLAIATERLRIADELGTVITRSIHTIAEHAGTGSLLIDTDPTAAGSALQAISAISRDALNDLRRLLKRIRAESDPTMYEPVAPTLTPAVIGESR